MTPLFVTGIGTGIGKTLVSAILAEAFGADYWKPVQAGIEGQTDSAWISSMLTNTRSVIHPEAYRLKMPASPHIAAREENIRIDLENIHTCFNQIRNSQRFLIIEGAGGLLVPLSEQLFIIDLIKKLQADVILVSRNYLGSINHSLLTAAECKRNGVNVKGWIFNDQYLDYEKEIVNWSGYRRLGSVPRTEEVNKRFILQQAELLKKTLI